MIEINRSEIRYEGTEEEKKLKELFLKSAREHGAEIRDKFWLEMYNHGLLNTLDPEKREKI